MAGTSYTRQSTFADGDTITAALFNTEFNKIVSAFAYASSGTTGHQHDGGSGEGGNIEVIGDQNFLNKILVDSSNNRWGFFVEVSGSAVEQIRIQDGAIVPVTDSDIDLGTSSLEFKDLFLDGTAHIDTLDVDANATIAGTLGVTGNTTVGGTLAITGNTTVGGTLVVTGTTTFNGGTLTLGDAASDNVVFGADVNSNIIPNTDSAFDLGSSGQEWRDLYLDGTAHIDTLDVDVNATVAGTLGVTGVLTGTSLDISGNVDIDGVTNLDVVDIDGAVDMASTLTVTGVLTGTSLDISGNVDVDGTTNLDVVDIDGAVNMATTLIVTGNVDFDGDLDVDGTTNLDVVDIDGAVNMATTLAVEGNVDFNGDLDVDGTIEFDAISGTGSVTVTNILDEDNMSSNSATALATQQSIKAYVDAQQDTVDTFGEVLALGNTTSGTNVELTTTDKVQFRDAAIYINSSADGQLDIVADTEIQIAATTIDINGAINASGEIIAASLDISGNIDVDGTTNLDVVDIDGAVDMASTLQVDGAATFTTKITANGGIALADNDKATFGTGNDLEIYHDASNSYITDVGTGNLKIGGANVEITTAGGTQYFQGAANVAKLFHTGNERLATSSSGITVGGTVTATGTSVFASLDISGDIDVDGTTNLDVVDIDGAVDMASTLAVAGDANFDSGTLFVDVSANSVGIGNGATAPSATLDVRRPDASGKIAEFHQSAGFGLEFGSSQAQSYIEAGSNQTLLITVPSDITIDSGGDIILDADGGQTRLKDGGTEWLVLSNESAVVQIYSPVSNSDIQFVGNDGGSTITALALDMSAAGAATFNSGISATSLDISGATTLTAATAINANIANPLTINSSLNGIVYSEIFNINTGANAAAYFGIVTQNLANGGTIRSGMFFDSSNHLSLINGEAGGAGIVLDDNNAVTMSGTLGVTGRITNTVTSGDNIFTLAATGTNQSTSLLLGGESSGAYSMSIAVQGAGAGGKALSIRKDGFTGTEYMSIAYATGAATFSGSLAVTGALSGGGMKAFKIDHPLKPDTHDLVHSVIEAPQADLLYSGVSDLVNGSAEVNIDEYHGMTEGTFVALNRNIRVLTTNESDWEPIKGSVAGNILSISCQDASCSDKVSWLVIGERQDDGIKSSGLTDEQGRVIVEPLKPEVPEEPAPVQRTISVPVMLDGEQVTALETVDVPESIEVIDGVAVLTPATTQEVLKPQFEEIGVIDLEGNPVYR